MHSLVDNYSEFLRQLTIGDNIDSFFSRVIINNLAATRKGEATGQRCSILLTPSPPDMYRMTGVHEITSPATVQYTINTLQLTEDDKHAIWQDDLWVPQPIIPGHTATNFAIPASYNIMYVLLHTGLKNGSLVTRIHSHMQLLAEQSCLLVVGKDNGDIGVFVEKLGELQFAIEHWRTKKLLHQDKIAGDCLVAFDETKRMLVVCSIEKVTRSSQ